MAWSSSIAKTRTMSPGHTDWLPREQNPLAVPVRSDEARQTSEGIAHFATGSAEPPP